MELNHLKYFYEVARLGSFTQASKALRVSQPSISKMVKGLEERESVRLLDRSKRGGVHLTPAGRRYFESCQKIFGEVELLQASALSEKGECAGPLSLGVSDNLACYLFPKLLKPYLAEHRRVQLKLFSGASEAIKGELVSLGVELGLFYTPVREAGFEAEKIADVEFALVVGAEALKARLAKSAQSKSAQPKAADLAGLPYIGSRAVDYAKPYPALAMLNSIGISPAGGELIEANHQETQKRLAVAGYGYTLVPRFMVKDELSRGLLKAVKTPKPLGSELYLVRRKGRTLSRPAELFGQHLRKSVGGLV